MNAPSTNQAIPTTATSRLAWRRRWPLGAKMMLPLLAFGGVLAFAVNRSVDHYAHAGLTAALAQRADLLAGTVRSVFADEIGYSQALRVATAVLREQPDIVQWSIALEQPHQILANSGTSSPGAQRAPLHWTELARSISPFSLINQNQPLTLTITLDHAYHFRPWESVVFDRQWMVAATVAAMALLAYTLVHLVMLRPLAAMSRLVRERHVGRGGTIAAHVPTGEMRALARRLDSTFDDLELMQRAVAASDHGLVVCDTRRDDIPIMYANPAFVRLTGYPLEQIIGRNCRFLQGQDHDQPGIGVLRQAIRDGVPGTALLRNYRKDGSQFWNQVQVSPIRNSAGELTHFIGIQLEVTTQEIARRELAESEERYRNLTDLSPEAILIQMDGIFTLVNPAAMHLLGATRASQIVGRSIFDFVHPEFHAVVQERIRHIMDSGKLVTPLDQRWLRVDGREIQVELSGSKVSLQGRVGIMVVAHDISQRKLAESRLRQAHAEAERLLATLSAIYIGIDANDRITRWNGMAERMFGISAHDAIGRTLSESGLLIDWAEVFLGISRCLSEGHPVEIHEIRFERPDGKEGFLSLHISNTSWSESTSDSESGIVLLGLDITERRVLESQRSQGLKLESIGQLAAGIAHEINTPIQFVGDNLRFLGDAFGDLATVREAQTKLIVTAKSGGDLALAMQVVEQAERTADVGYLAGEIPKAISQSLEGVERVANIVRAMKEFSHPDQGSDKRPADINKALATTLTVARNEYKYVADVCTDFAESLPPVVCVIGEINQVFLNLLVNAAHAIGDVVKQSGNKGQITLTTKLTADGWVEIRVSDTGTGIPEGVRDRIFDPFFTTKGVGKGTGQGLYLSHTIITKKHGGTIFFETTIGVGTTFIIRLPTDTAGAQ